VRAEDALKERLYIWLIATCRLQMPEGADGERRDATCVFTVTSNALWEVSKYSNKNLILVGGAVGVDIYHY
jgi:hypothetical protein